MFLEDKTFYAGEDVKKYRLAANRGTLAHHCDPHEKPFGSFFNEVDEGKIVTVRTARRYASLQLEVGGAISKGARVYPGLDGRVYAYGVQGSCGLAMEAATAAGDVIEILWLPVGDEDENLQVFELDSSHYVAQDQMNAHASDSGKVEVPSTYPFRAIIEPSDGSVADNDETYWFSTAQGFKFVNQKPIYGRFDLKHTEAATNVANLIAGFSNSVGANLLLDDGGGLKASGSSAAFIKVKSGTTWLGYVQDVARIGTVAALGAVPGGAWQTLELVFWPTSATAAEVRFYVDSTYGGKVLVGAGNTVTNYAGATDMALVVGAKNGSTSHEKPEVRRIRAVQFV